MSVYNKAHELARAISQSREYSELKSAFEKIKNDEKAKQMYKDLEKQIEVQLDEISGKNTDEKAKQLENLYEVLSYNDDLKPIRVRGKICYFSSRYSGDFKQGT